MNIPLNQLQLRIYNYSIYKNLIIFIKASKKLLNNVYNIEIFLNKTFNFKLSIIL